MKWSVIIRERFYSAFPIHDCLLSCYVFMVVLCCSCHKKFDEPPLYTSPEINANLAIRELRAMHFPGNFEKINGEFVIRGIVVADDSKDNFYKSMVVEDSTGGITIQLDGTGLYHDYPVGREVFIKLKDLWLGDYANMIQLGGGVDRTDSVYPKIAGIPSSLFDQFIVKGKLSVGIAPIPVRLDQLADSLQSCLVIIPALEFAPSDTGKVYGDAVNKVSVNNIVRACTGGSAYLRTSGFANFANAKTPRGNGSITAIYSVFRTEKQLMIRDTSDVRLNDLRCTGAGSKILFSEDFESATLNSNINLTGWKNIAESGGKYYLGKSAAGNRYAEISAFATSQATVASWLISPGINLNNSANEILSFDTKDAFDNGGTLQVYISTNYDGSSTPAKSKWTLLKTVISKGSVNGVAGAWVNSGNISLSSFQGTAYIAFRYDGADPVNDLDKRTTTFQLDNVKIAGN